MAGGPEIGFEIVMSARACVTMASKAPNKAIAIVFGRSCFRVMSRSYPIFSRIRVVSTECVRLRRQRRSLYHLIRRVAIKNSRSSEK